MGQGVPVVVRWKQIRLGTNEVAGSIPGLAQWVRDGSGVAMSCGVGGRWGLDPVLLWHRLATVALIRPLAWEPTHDAGVALKKQKKKKKKETGKKVQLYSLTRIWSTRALFFLPNFIIFCQSVLWFGSFLRLNNLSTSVAMKFCENKRNEWN